MPMSSVELILEPVHLKPTSPELVSVRKEVLSPTFRTPLLDTSETTLPMGHDRMPMIYS
jgi:hypothetical protein